MENSIKELIESATISGTITESEKNYILLKAKENGIDEIEVNILINANIIKNSSNSRNLKSEPNNKINEDAWITFKDFNRGHWVIFFGIVLIFISGFLPWIQAKTSGSGFGSSYGSKGSISGGFFYTLPLTILGIFLSMKKNLIRYRIYFGPIVFILMIGLIVSYSSKSSASAGGYSGSASTNAGPGVILMGISGLIYLIGALILEENTNKLKQILTHKYALISYLILLVSAPIWMEVERLGFNLNSIIATLIWCGLPILITKYNSFPKTYKLVIGNIIFYLLAIILPKHSDLSILYYTRKEFINFSSFYGVFYFVLCLTAITSDFITSKGKSNSKLSKINFLYNVKILGSIIIVPVITMGIYSASTKHAVTYEELDKFNKVNSAIEGYWYYINNDTSIIESFNIRFNNTISNDESGDVEIQMMAYFDQNDNLNLSKTELENKIKMHYDCKISFPVKFESAFEIVSCDSINLKGSIINAKGEKIILIAYKERNLLEEIVRIKKERTINQTSF